MGELGPTFDPSKIETPKKTKGPELPAGETYDVSGPKRALRVAAESPALAKRLKEGGEGRADDIFTSGELQEKIKAGDKVLYIGAGTGHVAKTIKERTQASVITLDIADLRTSDTKDKKFVIANARELPVKTEAIDVVCLNDVLHHTEKQEEILKEAFRALKPGGKVLLLEDTIPEEINIGGFVGRFKAKMKKRVVGITDDIFNQQPGGVNPHNYHPISDWEIMLHQAGFEVKADDTKSWHWGAPDFMGADRSKRPPKPTLLRPFQSTLLVGSKPPAETHPHERQK